MQFQLSHATLDSWTGDCAIILCFASAEPGSGFQLPAEIVTLDQKHWHGSLADLIQEQEFQARSATTASTRVNSGIRKVVVAGLGSAEQISLETIRRAVANGLRQAHSLKAKQVALWLPSLPQDPARVVGAIAEAALLTAHQDTRFKSQNKSNGDAPKGFAVQDLTLLLPTEWTDPAAYQSALDQSIQIAAGSILARELVAAPANVVTPVTLADTARQLAHDYGLEIEVLGQAECEALGMGAFLGVAQASDLPPQFIHLTYKPTGTPSRKLAVIGKGITFDSGGLNIKTDGKSIAMMKVDMGGAAATLGSARAIAAIKPNVEIHFLVAATENMISARAVHPGDILTASNQKTIEINNTDAEGRLTLADALVFAEKLEVDAMVDLATLTGACVVALGSEIAGLFTPNDELSQQLSRAATVTGEKIWRMPMEESYFESMNSLVADMKNTGSREGGSISAALFLKQFVIKTPWAHLDVAGPVWTERESGYLNKGATGFGVRLLVEWILSNP